jgi:SpoVK/Ycf46/Vps4 family AAA+-type ATPase
VFTLAEKLQPCIIFIDEIDTFLRSRDEDGHEVTNMMKAQFMILWDGLYSRKDSTSVMVLGATNRPSDVDEAIRRRMPAMFEIPLPNRKQRKALLKFMLKNETLDGDVDVEKLAELTEHFSSSDLKELCRNAVFTPVRDLSSEIMKLMIEDRTCDPEKLSDLFSKLRNVNNQDFQSTLVRMKENKVVCDKVTTSCTHHHVD